jgi:hypothetical protein
MSMDKQKIIKINPELFKIPINDKTKKNTGKKIRIKGSRTMKNSVNRNVLNHIRTKQNELFNTLVESSKHPTTTESSSSSSFQSDFDKALQHMNSVITHEPSSQKNKTIKQKPESSSVIGDFNHSSSPINIQTNPTYGCLVGGKLPTYRTWKKTLEPPPVVVPNPIATAMPMPTMSIPTIKNHSEIQQTSHILKKKITTHKPTKQKKTLKTKFNVGKSKYFPKIGVLISNRTLRNQTLQKTQQLKQTPVPEIRKLLVKKGLIKVGSSAPNDVLRKMYESVSLIVGDVQNHNIENIMHNFIHDN